MLVWFGRTILPFVVFGFLGAAVVEAQNTQFQGNRAGAIAPLDGGFYTLGGAEAALFVLPDDVELVNSMRLERYGLTYERYQQFYGAAKVLGGQLTLHRDNFGAITTVIGAHYPGIAPANAVALTAANARGIAERDIGVAGTRIVELMIDPRTGRHFFRVETQRPDSLWVLWIGAEGGQVINKYDALKYLNCADGVPTPCGFGVEYDDGDFSDVKNLNGLTDFDGTDYRMWSDTERLGTYNYWDYTGSVYPLARDDDNAWILLGGPNGDQSPAQPAEVDGQYYGHITNQYYLTRHTYDWVAQSDANGGLDAMVIMVHYGTNYNNAFWNKASGYVRFGDGDQTTFRAFPSLDIVGHELTHAVTDFTSGLIYQNESGALNEAIADIMATNIEFYAETEFLEPSPNLTADWFIGEDIYIPEFETPDPGFRNMKDPEEDGNPLFKPEYPDHYDERYLGSEDNGGVHFNSSIPNHAYYLLVNGGLNASCASPLDHNSLHCKGGIGDVGSPVIGIDVADAERVFFLGFIDLNTTATMCDARAATMAIASDVNVATVKTGLSVSDRLQSTTDAWGAVGLTDTVCENPTIGFVSPDYGADVSGRFPIEIVASDNAGIALVQFYVDDSLTCESATSPLTCMWNTKKESLGQHTLRARASNTTGNVAEVEIDVTVLKGGGGGGGGGGNSKPTASFTYSCTEQLECDFDGSGSSDSDGTIVSFEWDFGEGGSASGVIANHIYESPGSYTVTLTVTDNAGETNSDAKIVSVGDAGGSFALLANGYKVKGVQHVELHWSDAPGDTVDVYRDETVVNTISGTTYDDNIRTKGGGSYDYRVCDPDELPICSNTVTVVF